MCKGPIVDLPGRHVETKKRSFSLYNFFKNFLERVAYCSAVDNSEQYKVNMCLECGDLEIFGKWLKIPHTQKSTISKEIEVGRITINGNLKVCDFCAYMEKEIRNKRENLYKDPTVCSTEICQVSTISF